MKSLIKLSAAMLLMIGCGSQVVEFPDEHGGSGRSVVETPDASDDVVNVTPPVKDGGTPVDDDATTPPPKCDDATPPVEDVTVPPVEDTSVPPVKDASEPPTKDAGTMPPPVVDSGTEHDASTPPTDAGEPKDSGTESDAKVDSGTEPDAGHTVDSGTPPKKTDDAGICCEDKYTACICACQDISTMCNDRAECEAKCECELKLCEGDKVCCN